MIFTSAMVHLTAVIFRDYTRAASEALLKLGLLHLVDLATVDPDIRARRNELFLPTDQEAAPGKKGEIRRRIETILSYGGYGRPSIAAENLRDTASPTATETTRIADMIGARIDEVREQQRAAQQQIHRLEDVQRHLPLSGGRAVRDAARIGGGGTFLTVRTGTIPADRRESFEQKLTFFPAVFTPLADRGERILFILAGMKRNDTEIAALLGEHGFTEETLSPDIGTETRATLEEKLSLLRQKQLDYAQSIPGIVTEERSRLEDAWRAMRIEELMETLGDSFAHTRRVVIISGWLPANEQTRVEEALTASTDGHLYLEWHRDREYRLSGEDAVTIPSRLKNPSFLGTFQTLVTNFGTPAYGTIDPTPLVAVAYLTMFGLMFGDAGHGAVLIAAGLAIRLWLHRRPGKGDGAIAAALPLLGRLFMWCGGAAVIAGILFGSYFGFSPLPAVWFDYHGVVAGHVDAGPVASIFDILTITIYFGIAIISLGLLINWANLTRQRRWFDLIFDKSGVLGGTIYAGGIVLAFSFASSGFRSVPTNPLAIGAIVIPAVLLFLKTPLEGRSRNPAWWLMEWIISLLEVFTGYLANTLSFMRVAGLGIAHVTLMIAFFQIAEMASPEGFNAVAAIILIAGNILVIVLEGLSAGIQSLRLNYYEFFSKHFQPSGVAYKPITLEVS